MIKQAIRGDYHGFRDKFYKDVLMPWCDATGNARKDCIVNVVDSDVSGLRKRILDNFISQGFLGEKTLQWVLEAGAAAVKK